MLRLDQFLKRGVLSGIRGEDENHVLHLKVRQGSADGVFGPGQRMALAREYNPPVIADG